MVRVAGVEHMRGEGVGEGGRERILILIFNLSVTENGSYDLVLIEF